MDTVDKYTYKVVWSEEDGEFVGLCSEFPSLSWLEPNPDDALKGIQKIVKDITTDNEHSKDEKIKVVPIDWVNSQQEMKAFGLEHGVETEINMKDLYNLFMDGNDVALMHSRDEDGNPLVLLAVDKKYRRFRQR